MNETEIKQLAAMLQKLDLTAGEAMRRGALPDAILVYEQMLDAELRLGLEKNAGRTRINLANLYLQVGRNETALERAGEAIDGLTRCGVADDAVVARLAKARCLCVLDRKHEGVREAETALRMCRTDLARGEAALTLAECRRLAEDRWKARDAVDRAVRYFESGGDLNGLARALSLRAAMLEQGGQSAAAAADRARLATIKSRL